MGFIRSIKRLIKRYKICKHYKHLKDISCFGFCDYENIVLQEEKELQNLYKGGDINKKRP